MEYSIKSGSSWLFRITPIDFISYYPILLNQTVCVVRLGLRLGTDLAPTSTCWVLPWHGTKVPGPILKTNKHKKWYFHTSIWGSKKSLLGSTVEFFRGLFPSTGFGTSWFRFQPKTSRAALENHAFKGSQKTRCFNHPFLSGAYDGFRHFQETLLGLLSYETRDASGCQVIYQPFLLLPYPKLNGQHFERIKSTSGWKFQVSKPWTFKASFPCGIFESGDIYKYLPAKPRCPAKKVELLLALRLCPPITNQKRAETAGI